MFSLILRENLKDCSRVDVFIYFLYNTPFNKATVFDAFIYFLYNTPLNKAIVAPMT